ncbi:hypothetical protein Tco_0575255 [Tanacetum coccineum]
MSHAILYEQSIPQKFWCHALDTATYIFNSVYIRKLINKTPYKILRNRKLSSEHFRVFGCKEYLSVTLDESLLEPKSSPSVEDDRIIEPVVQNPVRSLSLEANASKPGYAKSLKEAKGHPIEQVIGELNEMTLRSNTK